MEKSKSDDESEESKAKEKTKRIAKVTSLFLGNPELDKLFKKPGSSQSQKSTSSAPKASSSAPKASSSAPKGSGADVGDKSKSASQKTSSQVEVTATAGDDKSISKRKPGRPRKVVEDDDAKKKADIEKDTKAAIAKKKKLEKEAKKASEKAAEKKKKDDAKAAKDAADAEKKGKLGRGGTKRKATGEVTGKRMAKKVASAWRRAEPDDNELSGSDGDSDPPPAKTKPSPRCKKPTGTYKDEDSDSPPAKTKPSPRCKKPPGTYKDLDDEALKKAKRILDYDTPPKGYLNPRTPTKSPKPRSKVSSDEDEDLGVTFIAEPDPDFASLTAALSNVNEDVTPSSSNISFLNAGKKQKEIEETFAKLEANLSSLPTDKVPEIQTQIATLRDEINELSEDTDIQSVELEMAMQMFAKRTQDLENLCKLYEEEKNNSSTEDMTPKKQSEPSVDQKVQAALEIIKKTDNYDPAMENQIVQALTDYYKGTPSQSVSSGKKEDDEKGQEKKKRSTKNVLIHVLGQILGESNVAALEDIFNLMTSKGQQKVKDMPKKKVVIAKDPLQDVAGTSSDKDISSKGPTPTNPSSEELSTEGKVQKALEIIKKNDSYQPSMEKDIKKALQDYYSGSSKGPEAEASSDKTQESKTSDESTKAVLLQVLGQILGDNAMQEMYKDIFQKPEPKSKDLPKRKIVVTEDPLAEDTTTKEPPSAGPSVDKDKPNSGTLVADKQPFGVDDSSDESIVQQKVKNAMEVMRRTSSYHQSMDRMLEKIFTDYFKGPSSSNEDKMKQEAKNTLLIHCLGDTTGLSNPSALKSIFKEIMKATNTPSSITRPAHTTPPDDIVDQQQQIRQRFLTIEESVQKALSNDNDENRNLVAKKLITPIQETIDYMMSNTSDCTDEKKADIARKFMKELDTHVSKIEYVVHKNLKGKSVEAEKMVEWLENSVKDIIPRNQIFKYILDEALPNFLHDYEQKNDEKLLENKVFTEEFLDFVEFSNSRDYQFHTDLNRAYADFIHSNVPPSSRDEREAEMSIRQHLYISIPVRDTPMAEMKPTLKNELEKLRKCFTDYHDLKILTLDIIPSKPAMTAPVDSSTPELAVTAELLGNEENTEVDKDKVGTVPQTDKARTVPQTDEVGTVPQSETSEHDDDVYVEGRRKERAAKERMSKKRTATNILMGTKKKKVEFAPTITSTQKDNAPSTAEKGTPTKLSTSALTFLKKAVKDVGSAISKPIAPPPADAMDLDVSDVEDLSSDSDNDKTYVPSKKEAKESSEDDIKDKPKKEVKSKKGTKPADSKDKTKPDAKSKKSEPKNKPIAGHRKPHKVFGTDFQAEGKTLLNPISAKSAEMLSWDEVKTFCNDTDLEHGSMNSYWEPENQSIYVIRNFVCNPENIKEIARRDNLVFKQACNQKFENMNRYKYRCRLQGQNDYSLDVKKYIFSVPAKNTLIVHYIGDTSKVEKHKLRTVDDDISDSTKSKTRKEKKLRDHPGTVELVVDVDNMEEAEYNERVRQSDQRRELKKRNALANYLRSLRSVPQLPTAEDSNPIAADSIESSKKEEDKATSTTITMKQRREAEEALILDNPNDAITNTELQAVIDEAVRIGEGIEDGASTFISVPEGGKLYLFNCKKMKRPWNQVLLNDSYRYVRKTHEYLTNFKFDKSKWYGRDINGKQTSEFKRYTYFNTQDGLLAIHYRGNVDMLGRPSHGNCRRATHAHVPTSKGLLDDVKQMDEAITGKKAHALLTDKLPGGAANLIIGTRGPRAAQHIIAKANSEEWMNKANEFNAFKVACSYTAPFCRSAITIPYLTSIFATDKALDELKKVIQHMPKDDTLLFHYDTTYEYGNYFLSILSYRHPLLQCITTRPGYLSDMPIVPLFYCMHEKKLQDTHKWMFNRMEHTFDQRYVKLVNNLASVKKVIVSDREFEGGNYLHNCETVHCWLHLEKNLDFNASKKPDVTEADKVELKKDFFAMIRSRSEETYIERRDRYMQRPHWRNTGMSTYFVNELDPDFRRYSGRWVLNRLGVGYGRKGISNNPAETLNSSISKFTDKERCKNRRAADAVLELFHFAQDSDKNLDMAYYSSSETFQVHHDFAFMKRPMQCAPSYNFESVKEMRASITQCIDQPHDSQTTETPKKNPLPTYEPEEMLEKIAKYHVDQQRVFDVPNQDLFFGVRDIVTDDVCWVDYMKDHCTCPRGDKEACHHKFAVKLRYGLSDIPGRKTISKKRLPLAYNPATGKTPIYGTKKPTKDDTYSVALHGVKKSQTR